MKTTSSQNVFKHASFFLMPLIVICSFASCQTRPQDPTVAPEMQDAFATASKLYGYVWDKEEFNKPSSEKTILHLLNRLADDFHRVEAKAPITMFEPGFTVTLQTHQRMLVDIRNRFKGGSKEYANWRLRNLSQNCISCHSRFAAPVDFIGAPPPPTDNSFESRFGAAQFLFATRQFEKAEHDLLDLTRSVGMIESGATNAFRALQLWLVIEVRVKQHYKDAAAILSELESTLKWHDYEARAIRNWIRDLQSLENRPVSNAEPLTEARGFLNSVVDSSSIDQDNDFLVRSLRASSILHLSLQTMPRSDKRQKATYYLALAYVHMPIDSFDIFRELYLEQCIREFPNSEEAQKSYGIYQDLLKTSSTGSGGLHLEEDQLKKLEELRHLAFGEVKPPKEEVPLRMPSL